MAAVDVLNQMKELEAREALLRCCGSARWVEGLLDSRPFANEETLFQTATDLWFALEPEDWKEAFSHHPKIGEEGLREKFKDTASLAEGEQSGVKGASEEVLKKLAEGNLAYEKRFGHIYIVFASGKTAEEMLENLEQRLRNERLPELAIAAAEQNKITLLRLEKLVGEKRALPQRSPITTHVLDVARGKPAKGIIAALEFLTEKAWKPLGQGITDADGRISDLLAANHKLEKGIYRLTFQTGAYQTGFYPSVLIVFEVKNPEEHYHVPLLLSPYGYSTYRGS